MDEIPWGEYRVRPKEGEEEKFQESLAFEFEETDSVEKRREWSERCLGEQGLRETPGVCGGGDTAWRVAFGLAPMLTCAHGREIQADQQG